LTSINDSAKFVIEAVKLPALIGDVNVNGEQLTINQITEKYEKIRGKKFNPLQTGNFKNLDSMIEEAKKSNNKSEETMLSMAVPFFQGRGLFDNLNNSWFPNFIPQTFEDWLLQH